MKKVKCPFCKSSNIVAIAYPDGIYKALDNQYGKDAGPGVEYNYSPEFKEKVSYWRSIVDRGDFKYAKKVNKVNTLPIFSCNKCKNNFEDILPDMLKAEPVLSANNNTSRVSGKIKIKKKTSLGVEDSPRGYWLWVAKPKYYLDQNGEERKDLDPKFSSDFDGWWTCHKDTKRGDLIFLWRTSPKSDIGYLIQAKTDANSLLDDDHAVEKGWKYGCEFDVIYKFNNPIDIDDLHKDPYFHGWGAYGGRFQRSSFRIPQDIWVKLNRLAEFKNPGYKNIKNEIERSLVSSNILLEEDLEDYLVNNLSIFRKFGYELELYQDKKNGITGRQMICLDKGRIDLICRDRRKNKIIVVELKNVRAGRNTFAQIVPYIEWVKEKIAGKLHVEGLVISRGYDTNFAYAMKSTNNVRQIDVEALGFD